MYTRRSRCLTGRPESVRRQYIPSDVRVASFGRAGYECDSLGSLSRRDYVSYGICATLGGAGRTEIYCRLESYCRDGGATGGPRHQGVQKRSLSAGIILHLEPVDRYRE